MPRLKNQHLDYEATTEPLCYVGLLTLLGSEWIFILNNFWSLDHPALVFFTIVVLFSLFFCSFGAHVDKITNLRGIYTALCVMILIWGIDITLGNGRVVSKVSPVKTGSTFNTTLPMPQVMSRPQIKTVTHGAV